MVWRLPVLFFFITVGALAIATGSETPTTQILVGFKPKSEPAEIAAVAKAFGLTQIKAFEALNIRVFTVPTTKAEATIAALPKEKIVVYAEIDSQVHILPGDPTSKPTPEHD